MASKSASFCFSVEGTLGAVCDRFQKILVCAAKVDRDINEKAAGITGIEAALRTFPHLRPEHMFGPSMQSKCATNANSLRQLGGVADQLHIVNHLPYRDSTACGDDGDAEDHSAEDKKFKRVQSLHIYRTSLKVPTEKNGLGTENTKTRCFQSSYGILCTEYGVSRKSCAVGKFVRDAVRKTGGKWCAAAIPVRGTTLTGAAGSCASFALNPTYACCENRFTVAWNVPASVVHDILHTASLKRMFSSTRVAFYSKFNFGYKENTNNRAYGVYNIAKHRIMFEKQCPLKEADVCEPLPTAPDCAIGEDENVPPVPQLLLHMLNEYAPCVFTCVRDDFENEKTFLEENLDKICQEVVETIKTTYAKDHNTSCFNAAEDRAKTAKAVLSCIISALSSKGQCGTPVMVNVKATAA